MDLILNQLYEFVMGMVLGGGLSFFYACYRLQFHSGHYSRMQLLVTDSLWWLFAAVITVSALFLLEWGALRVLFFLAFFLGFCLCYTFLWRPLWQKIKVVFMKKPKPPYDAGKYGPVSQRQAGKVSSVKEGSLLNKPFDLTAEGLYRGYSYGKRRYLAVKKQNQAAIAKWKKQISTEKQKLKHKVLQALWAQNKGEHGEKPLDEEEINFSDEEKK